MVAPKDEDVKPTRKKAAKKAAAKTAKKKASKKVSVKKKAAVKKTTAKKKTSKKKVSKKVSATKAVKTITAQQRYQMIAEAAYHLAEQHGFDSSRDMDNWFLAEKQISAALKEAKIVVE